jgi:2-keto-4-pentenoate hydratase/2-oxohepta-3-ene-1,7-dioic acid hydratase in catechol pathway
MKIICIGRNYAAHAKELKNEVPVAPVFFMKPDTALLKDNAPFFYPSFSNDIHYEVELVVKISKNGKTILPQFAHKYYEQITVGIDFTARDLQQQCKEKGLPWEIAKSFDHSAVLGRFVNIADLQNKTQISFGLNLNNATVQQGDAAQMIFSIDQIIAYVSQFVTLKTGDLIYTGTPAGVGPVKIGDRLQAKIENELLLDFEIK